MTSPPAYNRTVGLAPQDAWRTKIGQALGGYSPILNWYRRLRPNWLWLRYDPLGRATARWVAENGLTVKRGLAKGLTYPESAIGYASFLPTKLSGSYEEEIAECLDAVEGADLFVDVGAGEGYYCVSVAKRFADAHVIGYEIDKRERQIAQEFATINGVTIETRGEASPADLQTLPPGRLFLMADVEGYEYVLIDPQAAPRLRAATMLIEIHGWTHEGLLETLIERFADSHEAQVIHGNAKDPAKYPEFAGWSDDESFWALTEARNELPVWLFLKPHD